MTEKVPFLTGLFYGKVKVISYTYAEDCCPAYFTFYDESTALVFNINATSLSTPILDLLIDGFSKGERPILNCSLNFSQPRNK